MLGVFDPRGSFSPSLDELAVPVLDGLFRIFDSVMNVGVALVEIGKSRADILTLDLCFLY